MCDVDEGQRGLCTATEFHEPKVNTGHAGGHCGTLSKTHHVTRPESVKPFMSILSSRRFSYLKCDHDSQADGLRKVHYVTERAGFHPHWFQSSHTQIKLQTFIPLCEGQIKDPSLVKTVSKEADLK